MRALQRRGIDVAIGGRRGPVSIDLNRPATFAVLDSLPGLRVVVDVSSSHQASPVELARHCLDRGLVLLEASSDRRVVDALLALDGTCKPGAVVLGAGIFTGLSNLLAAEAVRCRSDATHLEVGVRSSPFSGGGGGTVDLMADLLAVPSMEVNDGELVEGPSVTAGRHLPFPSGGHATLTVAFPEPRMLFRSTGIPNIAMSMAPKPGWLRRIFLATPGVVLRSRAFAAYLRWLFGGLRRLVLARRPTQVELIARVSGPSGTTVLRLVSTDGMASGGVAIAAIAELLVRATVRGVLTVDQVMSLRNVCEVMKALDPPSTPHVSLDAGDRPV